jgi:hypothetical protein
MLKNNSMLYFACPNEFMIYYEDLNIYGVWKIQTGNLNERGLFIKDKSYVSILKKQFSEKKLFRRNVSIAEIVSWLDSYIINKRIFSSLRELLNNDEKFYKLEIFCEYKIDFSKDRRVDYIFKFEDKILLLEYRLSDHFPNMSNLWQKKELELIIYKELMNNYLKDKYQIYLYAFIAMPEYDSGKILPKHVKYNNDNIKYFCEYIKKFLFDEG